MIKITSVDKDLKTRIRFYDPKVAKFLTEEGDRIDMRTPIFDFAKREQERYKKLYPDAEINELPENLFDGELGDQAFSPMKFRIPYTAKAGTAKTPFPSKIIIQLGLGCNYNCAYCRESAYINLADATNIKDTEEFIANFNSWCRLPSNAQVDINLWGGEPLVYYAKLKLLVAFFRRRLPRSNISIITNGSLLDNDKVDFFISNYVTLKLSHDGPNHLVYRSGDCLETSDTLAAIKRYIEKSSIPLLILSTMTSVNRNPDETIEYITGILGNSIRFEFFPVISEIDSHIDESMMFTQCELSDLIRNIKQLTLDHKASEIHPFSSSIIKNLNNWLYDGHSIYKHNTQCCDLDSPQLLTINLKGDVLVSQITDSKIGHVSELSKVDIYSTFTSKWQDREDCQDCLAVENCWGGLSYLSGDSKALFCGHHYAFNQGLFEGLFELVFEETITSIEPETKRLYEAYLQDASKLSDQEQRVVFPIKVAS